MKKIAIIPVFNEEKAIIDVLNQVIKYTEVIIVINDGSKDKTEKLIKNWRKGKKNIYLISSPKNNGATAAIKKGYILVCHLLDQGIISPEDIAINIDGDGQHDPNYIPQLIEEFSSKNADIILARRDFSLYPYYKRIGNKGFAILASILTSFPYKDVNSNYRLMRAEIVPVLMGYLTGYRQSGSLEVGIITALLKYKIDNQSIRVNKVSCVLNFKLRVRYFGRDRIEAQD